MQKLIIFGGTFNPFHNGHAAILETLNKEFPDEKIIIIPNYLPPLKDVLYQEKNDLDIFLAHRVKMLQLMLKVFPFCELDFYEVKRKCVSYTINTIKRFQELYPTAELYYVIGSDNYFNLHNWKNYLDLIRMTNFIVINRKETLLNEYLEYEKKFKDEVGKKDFLFLKIKPVEISSSEIKLRVEQGKEIEPLVPKIIANYIKEHNLYKAG
ncbi:MAG: nicotinate (nicotinamide) nucleotide adenylyltransferase [Candidatus Margulisiibacteriota bacterium]|jgi:nicotinate-nucleotide adenylyltransferase